MARTENVLFDAAFRDDGQAIATAVRDLGCDPNFIHPRGGNTPLQLACEANSLEAIATLLSLGANPNQKFTRHSRIDGNEIVRDGVALMYAQSAAGAQLLVEAGADIEAEDSRGWTPIVWAAFAANVEVFNYLLSVGARTQVQLKYCGKTASLVDLLMDKLDRLSINLADGGQAADIVSRTDDILSKVKATTA